MNKILATILVICILCCCSKSSSELEFIKQSFNSNGITFDKHVKKCIIIPEGGCGGCIASGITFIKDNIDFFSSEQQDNLVIFTNIYSLKILKRNFEEDEWYNLNKIVDTDNLYTLTGDNSIYPLILILDNGDIINAMYQSPDSDAFSQIDI